MEQKKRDNEYKFIGVLIELGEVREGQTDRGPWQNQRFKVQEYGDYAQVVEFVAFGQTVEALKKIPLKSDVVVTFTITGKDYRSKTDTNVINHYNTLRASFVDIPTRKSESNPAPKPMPVKEKFEKPEDMPF